MRLLLDTHVFLWLMEAPERVSAAALAACENGDNEIFLSTASIWEMQIKAAIGKLRLQTPVARLVADEREANQLQVLPIHLRHVLELDGLPARHADPFDRMLVAQAVVEQMTLVSADRAMAAYPVEVLW